MYEEMERKKYSKPIQSNKPANIMQQKQEKINNSRPEGLGSGNVIQRTVWRYVGNGGSSEDGMWDEVDKGEAPSPAPDSQETQALLAKNKTEIDTSSAEFIQICAKHLWVNRGGTQNHTCHSPQTARETDKGEFASQYAAMYRSVEGQPGVRKRREYSEEEDIHRFLRWFSTNLTVLYGLESEVQCYYDKAHREVLIGVNSYRDMRRLSQEPNASSPITSKREYRHIKHYQRYQRVVREMIQEGSISEDPIRRRAILTNGANGLHAEQRILEFMNCLSGELREEMIGHGTVKTESDDDTERARLRLDPKLLGGMRRCCLACKNASFTEEDSARYCPGPLWPS